MDIAMAMYIDQQNRRMKQWERNQNLLHRNLFNRVQNEGAISLNGYKIIVNDLDKALSAFSHQPDLLTPLLSNALHRRDKDMLERALSEIYLRIMQG